MSILLPMHIYDTLPPRKFILSDEEIIARHTYEIRMSRKWFPQALSFPERTTQLSTYHLTKSKYASTPIAQQHVNNRRLATRMVKQQSNQTQYPYREITSPLMSGSQPF